MYHKGGLCWCKKKWGDEYGHILSGEKLRDSEADVICAPQPIAFNFKHQRLSPWNGLWPEIGAHLDHKEQTKNARKLMFPRGCNQPVIEKSQLPGPGGRSEGYTSEASSIVSSPPAAHSGNLLAITSCSSFLFFPITPPTSCCCFLESPLK